MYYEDKTQVPRDAVYFENQLLKFELLEFQQHFHKKSKHRHKKEPASTASIETPTESESTTISHDASKATLGEEVLYHVPTVLEDIQDIDLFAADPTEATEVAQESTTIEDNSELPESEKPVSGFIQKAVSQHGVRHEVKPAVIHHELTPEVIEDHLQCGQK